MVYSGNRLRSSSNNPLCWWWGVTAALSGFNLKSLILVSLPYLFKVLILEPTKIYQPSYLSINNEVEEKTISIWHVLPDDKVNCAIINTRALVTKDFTPF